MFEHVGVHHYDEFFKKLNALMPDDGVAVLHSIGHMSPPGMASAWLRKYIFPGAYSPALSEVFDVVEQQQPLGHRSRIPARALCHDARRIGASGSRQNRDKVIAMYDERFARMWEFYLISAEMMFRTGSQLVFHMQLSRSRDAAPIVRDYITDRQTRLSWPASTTLNISTSDRPHLTGIVPVNLRSSAAACSRSRIRASA